MLASCCLIPFPNVSWWLFHSSQILMPCSEHTFCCIHLIESNSKSIVLEFCLQMLYFIEWDSSVHTRTNTHFHPALKQHGVIGNTWSIQGDWWGAAFLYLESVHCFSGLRVSISIALSENSWYTTILGRLQPTCSPVVFVRDPWHFLMGNNEMNGN